MDDSKENINNDYYYNWKLLNKKVISMKKKVNNIGGMELRDKKLAYIEAKKDIETMFGSLDYLDLTIPQYDALLDKVVCDKVGLKFYKYKENENVLKNAIAVDVDGVVKKINKQLVGKIEEIKKLEKKLETISNTSKTSRKENLELERLISKKDRLIYEQTLEISSLTSQLQESFKNNNRINALLLEVIENKEEEVEHKQTQKTENSFNSVDNYRKERIIYDLQKDRQKLSDLLLEQRQLNALLKKEKLEAESESINNYNGLKFTLTLCGALILYIILS